MISWALTGKYHDAVPAAAKTTVLGNLREGEDPLSAGFPWRSLYCYLSPSNPENFFFDDFGS